MNFASSKEAWDFIASRIAGEATRQGITLSGLEKKSLSWSESNPTQTDMTGAPEELGDEYDEAQCAKKFRELSRKAFRQDQKESPENVRLWREAIKMIKDEEYDLLVLLDVPRPTSDVVKLVIAALIVTAALVGAVAAYHWAGDNIHFKVPVYIGYPAIVLVFAVAYYLSWSGKGKKLGDWLGDLAERVWRWF